MSHNTSYPSPGAAQVGDGVGPFYTNQQQRIAPQEELDLSAQLSREIGPNLHQNPATDSARGDQKYSPMIYAQGHPHMPSTPGPTVNNGEDSSKKKAKVSRACDECRRKKIRCDAESEGPGHKKCANCARTQVSCEFSRVPMKRGPSKGVDMDSYIKELADRVDSLEALRTHHGLGLVSNHSSPHGPEFDKSQELSFGRKRTHSAAEHGYLQAQLQHATDKYQPNGAWDASEGFGAGPNFARPNPAPFADMGYGSSKTALSPNGVAQTEHEKAMADSVVLTEAEAGIVLNYLDGIHPSLPLLADSTDKIRASLAGCSELTRRAFFAALSTTLRPINANTAPAEEVASAVHQSFEVHAVTSRDDKTNVVYLQTALFMLIATDSFGPPALQPRDIPSRGVWWGLAMEIANHLRLGTGHFPASIRSAMTSPALADARRAWWTMIVLDRCRAGGTANAQQIPDSVAVLTAADEGILGKMLYQLARLSRSLVQVSETFLLPSSPVSGDSTMAASFKRVLASQAEDLRESFQTLVSEPPLHTLFCHVNLLITRAMLSSAPATSDLWTATKALAGATASARWSPLTPHYTTLATQSLLDLEAHEAFRAEALPELVTLLTAIKQRSPPTAWDHSVLTVAGDVLGVRGLAEKGKSVQVLLHRPWKGDRPAAEQDWSALGRKGYLNAFNGATS